MSDFKYTVERETDDPAEPVVITVPPEVVEPIEDRIDARVYGCDGPCIRVRFDAGTEEWIVEKFTSSNSQPFGEWNEAARFGARDFCDNYD